MAKIGVAATMVAAFARNLTHVAGVLPIVARQAMIARYLSAGLLKRC